MHCIGRLHFQRQMRSLAVVDAYRLLHHPSGLPQIRGALQQKLALQDAVDPLGQRVLVAVVAVRHRADYAMALVQSLVVRRAVLDTPVGVVHQLPVGLRLPLKSGVLSPC